MVRLTDLPDKTIALDRMSLQIIYFSFIRWDNCTQYEASELEKIQNEAAGIVTGATELV